MAVNKLEKVDPIRERMVIEGIRRSRGVEQAGDTYPLINRGEEGDRDVVRLATPYLHNAFMQCARCCNCSFQCSHYGRGHFDDHGNYVGPQRQEP
ncbi:MAG: hypothetical protein JSV26_05870 [bacterium]|nr:MAG: hypothetical protein JSV26_05870 [bacterium]